MRKLWISGWCLLTVALVLYSIPRSYAVGLPGPSSSGLCVALDDTCGAVDSAFTPASVSISVKGAVTSVSCSGTSTTKPTKTTKCDGEALGGANENVPTQACVITIGGKSTSTDDWSETITTKGSVKLKCIFGAKDTK
jgi:hypothetical protein